jgi:hypothetical protein
MAEVEEQWKDSRKRLTLDFRHKHRAAQEAAAEVSK